MTGAPTDDTKIEVLAVDVENKFDKDITAGPKFSKMNESIDEMEIDLKEEQRTWKYKVTLNIDIDNIIKIPNIHLHLKRHLRTIYGVIQQELFDEIDVSPDKFLKHCKNNANVPITNWQKNNTK